MTDISIAVLRRTNFDSDLNGHGGNRRTAQIAELVKRAGFSIQDIDPTISTRFNRYCTGLQAIKKYRLKFPSSYRTISTYGYECLVHQQAFQQHTGSKVILWEATSNYITPNISKVEGIKIISLLHNLESLVPSSLNLSPRRQLFRKFEIEVQNLAIADAIFCISREEQWLLKLFGIDADFLPYYPHQNLVSNLLEIRKSRAIHNQKNRFLILGTCYNPPTKIGMIEQIQWLSKIKSRFDFEVDIAGYGTETLVKYCQQTNFNLIGSVEPEKLNYLLSNAKAILVHQQAGVGALTRIPEMLISGIPVIANANACRSAFSYAGVYWYDSEEELEVLMKQNLDLPPILSRPKAAEKRFIECITELVDSQ